MIILSSFFKQSRRASKLVSASRASQRYKSQNVQEETNEDIGGTFTQTQPSNQAFTQEQPVYRNPYEHDPLLKSYLKRNLPPQFYDEVDKDLHRFGNRISDEIEAKGRQCELKAPTLNQFNAWGNRIDDVETCEEWRSMKGVSAQEGLIAIGYERKFAEWSRLVQMSKLFVFAPSSGLYSCPLAMADGATKLIENVLLDPDQHQPPFLLSAFQNLCSRDPDKFWTSGQWMTEKEGGSDVANGTATVAHAQPDGSYRLSGYKWFTSATDSDMAFTLARIVDPHGNIPPGSKGLSLFYVETRDPLNRDQHSGLNGLQVQRLKSKLGTRQLPTGELLLDGTRAHLVGKPSQGVKLISNMLTITRIHTGASAASNMRRIVHLARDYATKRRVFGQLLCTNDLHMHTLARMEVETRAAGLLVLDVSRLLGVVETRNDCDSERDLLRLLTPVCKLYTAKQAMSVISEGVESFGGAGYLEDTDLPRVLRDAQVSCIWEGTTNVLSLDTLRAIAKSRGQVLNSFFRSVNDRLSVISEDCRVKEMKQSITKTRIAASDLRAFIKQSSAMGPETMFVASREFAFSIARIYCAILLLEQATWDQASVGDIHAAISWCSNQDLCPAASALRTSSFNDANLARNKELLYEGYTEPFE